MLKHELSDELCHYGILGMKWGVRKKYDTSDGQRGTVGKRKSKHRLKLEETYQAKGMSQSEAEKATARRIRAEKFAASAAVITVAVAVAYVARNEYVKKQTLDILTNMGKSDISNWSDIQPIIRQRSFADDVIDANPNFKKGRPFKANCTYSTIAYELRRRGLSVEAMPIATEVSN